MPTVEAPAFLKELTKAERDVEFLVEVNVANEPQKTVIVFSALDETTFNDLDSAQLHFRGLMTIDLRTGDAEEMPLISGSTPELIAD